MLVSHVYPLSTMQVRHLAVAEDCSVDALFGITCFSARCFLVDLRSMLFLLPKIFCEIALLSLTVPLL